MIQFFTMICVSDISSFPISAGNYFSSPNRKQSIKLSSHPLPFFELSCIIIGCNAMVPAFPWHTQHREGGLRK